MAGHYELYKYEPSQGAAIAFSILFFIPTALHLWQIIAKRSWFFIPFLIGGVFEFVGYIARVISTTETPDWSVGVFIVQTLMILIAPALFAASIYMILGRLVRVLGGESLSIIRPDWITRIFVTGDVVSFLMQCGGGGMLASRSLADIGNNIVVGGLGVQVLFFGAFVVTSAIFQWRISRYPTERSRSINVPWTRLFWVVYAASGLIFIRSIFRLIEYVQGRNGVLLSTEAYMYGFDAALMLIVVLLFNLVHPTQVLKRDLLEPGTSLEEGKSRLYVEDSRHISR